MTAQPRRRTGTAADRMLDVAVARIERDGMSVGLDSIRMEQVIAAAGVSRASAYRRWPTRDDFLADVLVETVRRTSLIPETDADLARLVQLVQQHRDTLPTEQGRRDLVVEALRVSVDSDVRRILASPRWRSFQALCATLPSLQGRTHDVVQAALVAAEDGFQDRRAEVYQQLCDLIGYRLRPSAAGADGADGFRRLSATTGALMTGIVVRAIPEPGWLDRRERVALNGASRPADWSEPERMLVGTLLAHLEPDPAVVWSEATVAAMLARFESVVAAMFESTKGPAAPEVR